MYMKLYMKNMSVRKKKKAKLKISLLEKKDQEKYPTVPSKVLENLPKLHLLTILLFDVLNVKNDLVYIFL